MVDVCFLFYAGGRLFYLGDCLFSINRLWMLFYDVVLCHLSEGGVEIFVWFDCLRDGWCSIVGGWRQFVFVGDDV